jgi:hypothetical protein
MSKKKRDRKLFTEAMEEFPEMLQDAQQAALEFLSTASPMEICVALTELGVSTVDRAGIEAFLKAWMPNPQLSNLVSADQALSVHWIAEIHRKRGAGAWDIEDEVFLVELARFYWLRLNATSSE